MFIPAGAFCINCIPGRMAGEEEEEEIKSIKEEIGPEVNICSVHTLEDDLKTEIMEFQGIVIAPKCYHIIFVQKIYFITYTSLYICYSFIGHQLATNIIKTSKLQNKN